ncbi:MAG: hypothetical protein IT198_13680 [Acidimicrobiia bacterium]|nr:hypothetical protein [Acidimicrobiia bacterium]
MTVRCGRIAGCGRLGSAALALTLVALPACRVAVRTDVTATWRGTGTFTVSVTLDAAARAALTELGIGEGVFYDESAPTSAPQTSTPPEATPEPFADLEAAGWVVRPGSSAVVLEHEFGDPAQLSSLAAQVSGDVTPPLFPQMDLTVEAGLFTSRVGLHATVAPTAELVTALAGRGLASPPSVDELERALGVPVKEAFEFVFGISLPGREAVVTEPADAEAAGRNAWEVPVGTTLDVQATTTARTPAFWVAVTSIGLALLLATALAFLEIRTRDRNRSRPQPRGGLEPRSGPTPRPPVPRRSGR